MINLDGEWLDARTIEGIKYICGYCSVTTSGSGGYYCVGDSLYNEEKGYILLCTNCNYPTFINYHKTMQTPYPNKVSNVDNLPETIKPLFKETRDAISFGLFNASVLLCRKMLMNIAVNEGGEENKKFAYYVGYLEENGIITKNMKQWVDEIRNIGNIATHEIPDISKEEAHKAFDFIVMLLKLMYEFPEKMQS